MPQNSGDLAQLMTSLALAVTENAPHVLGEVFAADAEFVNLFGSVWQGRQAIIDGHAWSLGSVPKDSTMQFESINTRPVGDEVAVMRGVCRRGRTASASAETLAPGMTVLLMVAQHGQDGWKAVAGANVAQQAPAA
jgi:uncharacterized protein (TIGR02246 family)